MKICAYSQLYLNDALRNMGELFEFAEKYYDKDMDSFLRCFIISGFAKRWDDGDPRVICGISGTEAYYRILDTCGVDSSDNHKPLVKFDTGESYWAGYIMAYYHWASSRRFADIVSYISYDRLRKLYPAYHTASEEKCVTEFEKYILNKQNTVSRLQFYRKALGMTQKALAEQSGVNLHTLQQYEIKDKDIAKASFDKVSSLASVLNCRPEEIIN